MTNISADALLLALRPLPGDSYALLDGAAITDLPALLAELRLPHYCLYRGARGRELRDVAPYLLRLDAEGAFIRHYARCGWGASWGVFFNSAAGVQILRRHCRRLLQVQDTQQRSLYLRYYDPRVLSVFLPTCDAAQLQAFFGPVSCFYSEAPAEGQLRLWLLRAGMLVCGRLPLGGRIAATDA